MMSNPKRISRGLVAALWVALAASVALPLLVPAVRQWYYEVLLHAGGGAPGGLVGGLALMAVATLVIHLQSDRWRPVTRCLLYSQALHALLILCFQLMRIPVIEPQATQEVSRVTVSSGLPSLLESASSARVREDLLALRPVDTRTLAERAQPAPTPAAAPMERERPAPAAAADATPRELVDPAAPASQPAPRVEETLAPAPPAPAPEVTAPEVARARPVETPVSEAQTAPVDRQALEAARTAGAAAAPDEVARAAAPLASAPAAPRPEAIREAPARPEASATVAEAAAARATAQAERERVALAARDQPLAAPVAESSTEAATPADVTLARREAATGADSRPARPAPDTRLTAAQAEASAVGSLAAAADAPLAGEATPSAPADRSVALRAPAANPEADGVRLAGQMTLAAAALEAPTPARALEPRAAVAAGRPAATGREVPAGAAPPVPGAPLSDAPAAATTAGSLARDTRAQGALARTETTPVTTELAHGQVGAVAPDAPLELAPRAATLSVSVGEAPAPPAAATRRGEAIAVAQSPGSVALAAGAALPRSGSPARVAGAGAPDAATLVAPEAGLAQGEGTATVAPVIPEAPRTGTLPLDAPPVDGLALAASAQPIPASGTEAGAAMPRAAEGRAAGAGATLSTARATGTASPAPVAPGRVQGPVAGGGTGREAQATTFAGEGALPMAQPAASTTATLSAQGAPRAEAVATREAVALGRAASAEQRPGPAATATSTARPAGGAPVEAPRTRTGMAAAEAPEAGGRLRAVEQQAPTAAARALVEHSDAVAAGATPAVDSALASASDAPRAWTDTDRLPLALSPQVDQRGELVYTTPQPAGAAASQPMTVARAASAGPAPAAATAGAAALRPGAPLARAAATEAPAPTRLIEIPDAVGGHARIAIPDALPEGARAQTYRAMLAGDLRATPLPARQKLIYSLRDRDRRRAVIDELGGSAATEAAVERALRWLATAQSPDGRWDVDGFRGVDKCGGAGDRLDGDVGVTGLALLAYFGAGYTQDRGDFREPIRKALDWLIAGQTAEGDLRRGGQLYSHAMAAAALCEAYSLSGEARLLEPARRAVQYIVDAQTPGAGWRYEPRDDSDTSVTGWMVLALKSAEIAGISVPPQHYGWTAQWLDRVRRGQIGGLYAYKEGHGATPVMTAEGWFCQLFMDPAQRARGEAESVSHLMENLPAWAPQTRGVIHFYYWYYATLALHLSGRSEFDAWNEALREALLKGQRDSGPAKGSWDPIDQLGERGGRIYSTTMATLCLEVYYRYLPFYQAAPSD